MKKRTMMLVVSMTLAVLLIAGGTFAWFTAQADPVVNEFKAGTLLLGVTEVFDEEMAQNVNPGDCYEKIVRLCNEGTKRMFVRVAIDAMFEDELETEGVVSYDIGEGWIDGGDGYYYYQDSVCPGHCTPELITEVCFDGENMDNDYQGKGFTLTITPDAVQATNGAADSVWSEGIIAELGLTLLDEGYCGGCPAIPQPTE